MASTSLGRQIGGVAGARPLREGAVMAHVAAQLRQRDEHFARIGDHSPEGGVALLGGLAIRSGKGADSSQVRSIIMICLPGPRQIAATRPRLLGGGLGQVDDQNADGDIAKRDCVLQHQHAAPPVNIRRVPAGLESSEMP